MSTGILWLRRELRLHDHPALHAALASHERVAVVFCMDRALLAGRNRSPPRTRFLLECLCELDSRLRSRGSLLIVRDGPAERELPALAARVGAESVHASADASPYARRRERRAARALARAGVKLRMHAGVFVLDDPAGVRTRAGDHYRMFTPYHRAWLAAPRRPVLRAPARLAPPPAGVAAGALPSAEELGLGDGELAHAQRGGETAARRTLARFLAGSVSGYEELRDIPAAQGSSRLSAYLHLGCLSAREVEQRLGRGAGAEALRRQLCWRDFYAQVLAGSPRNTRSEHQARYRGTLRWSRSRLRFAAWCEGRTGYPLVDAGMRQLSREGFMHNRVRLVAGSFLTKDLGIDWRWGERWFMGLLLDGDEASNNGNWQWIASVGVDPEPPSRRILSPVRQQARFDPGGEYVHRYVPELRRVHGRWLLEPWRMPPEVQALARCVIGRDYPAPIVDHAQARREALARYAAAPR